MKKYILIVSIGITLLLSFNKQVVLAKNNCLTVDKNFTCQKLGQSYILSKNFTQDCSAYMPYDTICCCDQSTTSTIKPKYLLISGVIAFFALLTTFVIIHKHNA